MPHEFERKPRSALLFRDVQNGALRTAKRFPMNPSAKNEVRADQPARRLHDASEGVSGMAPGRDRTGGAGMDIRFAVGECSLGSILVAQSERGLCAIFIGEGPDRLVHDLRDRFPQARPAGCDEAFERRIAQVAAFIEAPAARLDLPLDVRGTAFQQRVWQAMCAIPAGETVSYSELARRIGAPRATRAVASACAANVLAVAIPCHRVVRSDGGLSGYRWGVERKRALLAREAGRSVTW